MRSFIVTGALAVLGAVALQGQVTVEIINMPTEVYSFGPVYVLYAVENTGQSPLYLPAETAPNHGPGIYIAPAGETPRRPPGPILDRVFSHAQSTMWLAPGERWLFYRDIGLELGVLEGEVAIQAIMSSDGRCGDELTYGRHSFPLGPLHIETFERESLRANVYRCWQGEARSSIWNLTIRRPTGPVDQEAQEYLLQNRGLIRDPETGLWWLGWGLGSASGLKQKYPTSHYTYALMTYGGASVYEKREALELQPQNPLNPWVMAAIARDWLDHRSSCSRQPKLKFDLSIASLELPTGAREYLDQYDWYLEHRYCPWILKEKGGKNQ